MFDTTSHFGISASCHPAALIGLSAVLSTVHIVFAVLWWLLYSRSFLMLAHGETVLLYFM